MSANQRIEDLRKGPLNVKVVDSNGNAISGMSGLFFSILVDDEDDGWWQANCLAIGEGQKWMAHNDMFAYWCAGASVKVLQQRHEFPLGTAVDHWTIADNSNQIYKAKILEYFNYIVLENGLKQVYWVHPPVPHIFNVRITYLLCIFPYLDKMII